MTFYNVISGILFLAACQVFLQALGTPTMWIAAILVVTILNESVLTSELIERITNPISYSLRMKLIDFVTFTIFSWALLVLSPADNIFNVDVESKLWGAHNPRIFWLLLIGYWVMMLIWNQVAGQRDQTKWKPWFYKVMHMMWLPPLVALIFNWETTDLSNQAGWTVWLNLGLICTYLLSKDRASA